MPIQDSTIPNPIELGDEVDNDTLKYDTKSGTWTSSKLYVADNVIYGLLPIGSIIPWAKNISGVPSLPEYYAECNGQTINDTDSPLNGQTLPNLNTNKFLRGNTTSGGTGGSATHNHTTGSGGGNGHFKGTGGSPTGSFSSHTHSVSSANNEPPYYDVVFIMRIK